MSRVAVMEPSAPVSVAPAVLMALLSGTTLIGTPATAFRFASTSVIVTVAFSAPVFFRVDLSVVITSAFAVGVCGFVALLVGAPPLQPAISAARAGIASHDNFILFAP